MRKIKYMILTIILMFPIIIKAGTYDVEVNKANNLLNKENFVNTYDNKYSYQIYLPEWYQQCHDINHLDEEEFENTQKTE